MNRMVTNGTAWLIAHENGTISVERADPIILVSTQLLDSLAENSAPQWNPTARVLTLDTDGEYRYEWLDLYPDHPGVVRFQRIGT